MVNLCIEKIKNGKAVNHLDENTRAKLFASLKALPHVLSGHEVRMGFSSSAESSNTQMIKDQMQHLTSLLDSKEVIDTAKTYALMLIRLLVLQEGIDSNTLLNIMVTMRPLVAAKAMKATTRAMAWCVLSNALGSSIEKGQCQCFSDEILQSFVDLATDNLSEVEHVDVRRGAAAFLYNLALLLTDRIDHETEDVSDLQVTILCGVVEAVMDETDVEVAKRIMLVVGKIIKPCQNVNSAAAMLIVDLGYLETLISLRQGTIVSQESGIVVGELVNEIVQTIGALKV